MGGCMKSRTAANPGPYLCCIRSQRYQQTEDFVQGSAASRLHISLKPLRKFWRATYHEFMVFNQILKERLIGSSQWRLSKSINQKCLVFIHNCSTYRHFYYNVRLVQSHYLYHKSPRDLLLAHSQLTMKAKKWRGGTGSKWTIFNFIVNKWMNH